MLIAVLLVPQLAAAQGQAAPEKKDTGGAPPTLAVSQFTIGESGNVLRLAGTTGSAALSATLTGADKATDDQVVAFAQTLVLTDKGVLRGGAPGTTVQFGKPEFIGRSGNTLTWRAGVEARDLAASSQTRQGQASIGQPSVLIPLEYTVTLKPVSTIQWDVKGSTPVWSLSWSGEAEQRQFELLVTSPDEPLRNVRLVQSTLHDAAGNVLGSGRLRVMPVLPDGRSANAGTAVHVATSQPTTIRVQFEPLRWFGDYGTFDGDLRFAADNGAIKDVTLKVQASSSRIRLAGIAFVILGLALTATVATIRTRAARVAALRPVLIVRESAQALAAEAARIGPAVRRTADAIDLVRKALTDATLDGERLLPPRAVFASAGPPADAAAALKAHVEKQAARLAALAVVLREGIVVALERPPSPERDALVQDLDALAPVVGTAADARDKVAALLNRGRPEAESVAADGPSSIKDAEAQLTVMATASWVIWGVLSLAVAAVWIVNDVDYGTPSDLILSFLWGAGITGFGASVQSLTTSSIATQVNVKLPA
jgi:hypothetical protein